MFALQPIVQILAVSKGHGSQSISDYYSLGIRDFGENYAGELAQKAKELQSLNGIKWHFIGHLQTNKVKGVLPFVSVLHSLNRPSLLQEIQKQLPPDKSLDVYIQLLVDEKDTAKHGASADEALEMIKMLPDSPQIVLKGFMGMGPADATSDKLKSLFQEFAKNAETLWAKHTEIRKEKGLQEKIPLKPGLSLGMSDDLAEAIAAGSTCVRIGTALFGPRSKP
jgi:PLP dependent protein